MSFNSKHKSSEIEEILDSVSGKQDKEEGKGLSTEDFTSALKTKLEGLSNYDDTELSDALSTLRGDFDKLVSGDTTTAIKTFNEVIAFLDGIADTEDLNSIIASIEQQIANKANADSLAKVATSGSYDDLTNKPTIPAEQVNADWNATSGKAQILNKPTIPNGTITGVSANGTSVATSGVANIPAATTGKYGVTKLSSATNSTSTTLAATPSAVKSAYDLANGKYTKPSTGIPFGDFEEQVQGSIIKAEESVQSVSMSVTTGNATAGNFFNVNKDANGNVSIQMIQNTLASGKIAIPYTTDVKQYIDQAIANAGGGGGVASEDIRYFTDFTVELVKAACLPYTSIQSSELDMLVNAVQSNKIICVPYRDYEKGFLIATYKTDDVYIYLSIIEDGCEYRFYCNKTYAKLYGDGVYASKPLVVEIYDNDSTFHYEINDNLIYILGNSVEALYVYPLGAMPIGSTIRFITADEFTLGIAENFMWANGTIPTIEPNTAYELSIAEHSNYGYLAVLTPFKFIES